MTSPAPAPEEPSSSGGLPRLIRQLAALIEHELSPGDLAELRRLSTEELTAPAFWRIAATHLIPHRWLAEHSSRAEPQERTWAALLSGMAHMKGLHRPERGPGHALREARFSELRLTRLLRARDEALLDHLRGVARYLAAKAEPVDWAPLATLALFPESPSAERARRRIARDYYTQSSSSSPE